MKRGCPVPSTAKPDEWAARGGTTGQPLPRGWPLVARLGLQRARGGGETAARPPPALRREILSWARGSPAASPGCRPRSGPEELARPHRPTRGRVAACKTAVLAGMAAICRNLGGLRWRLAHRALLSWPDARGRCRLISDNGHGAGSRRRRCGGTLPAVDAGRRGPTCQRTRRRAENAAMAEASATGSPAAQGKF